MSLNDKQHINHIIQVKNRLRTKVLENRIYAMGMDIQPLLRRCIVTGGCISSLILEENINDFDLLFQFEKDLRHFCNTISNKQDVQKYIKDIDETYGQPIQTSIPGKCATNWAVTFKNDLQLILRTSAWRDQFDFIHCMPYYDITKNKLFISPAQYDAIINKKLVKNRKRLEEPSLERIQKYIDKGWLV